MHCIHIVFVMCSLLQTKRPLSLLVILAQKQRIEWFAMLKNVTVWCTFCKFIVPERNEPNVSS